MRFSSGVAELDILRIHMLWGLDAHGCRLLWRRGVVPWWQRGVVPWWQRLREAYYITLIRGIVEAILKAQFELFHRVF